MNDQNPHPHQSPVLFEKTQEQLADLRKMLGAPVISYWNSSSGSVCQNDVTAMHDVLSKLGHQETIYLFIKTRGGTGQASMRIVNLLRQRAEKVIALVSQDCLSAGTMMALGADEVQMGPVAYLSPVDTAINHSLSPTDQGNRQVNVSHEELDRVLKLWTRERTENDTNPFKTLYKYVHPLVIGAVDRAESLSIRLCSEILSHHVTDRAKAEEISARLNGDYPSHTYPILLDEARRIGINALPMAEEVDTELVRLNDLYGEMGQLANTDYSESRYHSAEIRNIIETNGVMIYYGIDKDWVYWKDLNRWEPLNDKSGWIRVTEVKGKQLKTRMYIT